MLRCSFCGKTENQVLRMLFATGCAICDECVVASYQMLLNDGNVPLAQTRDTSDMLDIPPELVTPAQIKAVLDEYIIGQDEAKRTLCVSVYNHYKRTLLTDLNVHGRHDIEVELQKSNVLLLGPTGVGKTMLAQTLAQILHVPFAIADATTLTQAGYVGEDVENVLLRLIQAADFDVASAEKGIIYIDEIDKVSRRDENTSITRDVSGEGVQQALLKIIEGTVSNVPPSGGRKHPHQDFIQIDTSNILFICGGAFDGLTKTIVKRIHASALGFGAEVKTRNEKDGTSTLHQVTPEDLVRYGIIPELVGRLPVIAVLDELEADALMRILVEPKNALVKQYQYLFNLDGIELSFDESALRRIAERSLERKTGARGLRSIMESLLKELMFELPDDGTATKVFINAAVVDGLEEPVIEHGTVVKQRKFRTQKPPRKRNAS